MKRNCRIKTNSFFLAAVVLLTSLTAARLAAAPVAAPVTGRQLPRLMPSPELALQRAVEIGLTAEQRAKLESALRDSEVVSRRFAENVRRESDALANLLASEAPDLAAVAAQFDKVLAAEDEVKRVRLKLSLQARAVLTPEQQSKLAAPQDRGARARPLAPGQQELATRMERVKQLIERAKGEGRDLSAMREMWKRVDQFTREGKITEASRVLEETAQSLEGSLAAPAGKR